MAGLKQRSTLFKIFFSYFALIFIISIFSFVLNNIFVSKLKNEINQKIAFRGSQVMEKLESRFVEMRNITAQLSMNSAFLSGNMLSGPSNIQNSQRLLNDISGYNNYISSTAIYFGGDYYYTSGGYVRSKVYFEDTLRCSKNSVELALGIIGNDKASVTYLGSAAGGCLLFHYPPAPPFRNDQGHFNYIIDYSRFIDMFQPLLELSNARITVTFGEGNYFSSFTAEGDIETGFRIVSNNDAGRNNYVELFSASSGYTDIHVKASYPEKQIYMSLNNWWSITNISLAFILILAATTAFIVSLMYYRRISNVKLSLEKLWDSAPDRENQKNEFDYINSMIDHLDNKYKQALIDTTEMKTIMKQYVVNLLIKGALKDEKTINGMLESCGVSMERSFFTLLCILYRGDSGETDLLLREFFSGKLYCKTKINEMQSFIVIYDLHDSDPKKQERNRIIEDLKKNMQNPGNIYMGLSRVYDNLTMVSFAYIEAVKTAEDLINSRKEWSIGFSDSITDMMNNPILFSEKEITAIETSLEKNDLNTAIAAFTKLLNILKTPGIPEAGWKQLKYLLVQTVIMGIKKTGNGRELIQKVLSINTDDLDEFENKITEVFRETCTASDSGGDNDLKRALNYINENFSRPDLSLDEVAHHVNHSRSHMSRIFREKSGYGYIEYITRLRMDKAKKLLITTDLPIKAIAEMAGYINVSGFRSKFKTMFGISAFEYRKNPE